MRKLKENIGRSFMRKKVRKMNRKRTVHNLNTAKKVGLVFSLTENEVHLQQVVAFINFLLKLKMDVNYIAYCPLKKTPPYMDKVEGLQLYTRKNLKWTQSIEAEEIDVFINTEFDVLIDLSEKPYFPLEYIVGLSHSNFKVGRFIEKNNLYDFMLDLRNKPSDTGYYIEQLKHYLALINN